MKICVFFFLAFAFLVERKMNSPRLSSVMNVLGTHKPQQQATLTKQSKIRDFPSLSLSKSSREKTLNSGIFFLVIVPVGWHYKMQRRKKIHDHHRKKIFWGTFLASRKNIPGRWWIQKPCENQETISTTEIFPLWPQFSSAKKSSALEQGGVCFPFPRNVHVPTIWDVKSLAWRIMQSGARETNFSGTIFRQALAPPSLPWPSNPCFFFGQKKKRGSPEKSKDFPLCRTLEILGKESKNAQKNKENRKTKQGRALYGPMPVKTETFRELWAPLVHTNFGGNSYGPIIGPYLFLGKFVWTNGPESSSRVSPYTGIGPWMALPSKKARKTKKARIGMTWSG